MSDRGRLVFGLDSRDEAGSIPFGRGFSVGEFASTLDIPSDMAERFELRGQPLGRRFCSRGEEQPSRRRRVGMRHAVFEPAVAEPEGMYERVARVVSGTVEPRRFARHARAVVIEDRGLDAAQRAGAALFGRRVAEIDEDLTVALRDFVGADRVAADQRRAAREIEFPIVPVAGQHASRPDRAFAQWITLVWAAIAERKQLALMYDDEHLLAVVPQELLAMAAEFTAFQPSRGKHLILPSCWGDPVGAAAGASEEVVLAFDAPTGSEKVLEYRQLDAAEALAGHCRGADRAVIFDEQKPLLG